MTEGPPQRTYNVNPHIAAALATGRSVLLKPLRNQVEAGTLIPTPEEYMEILDLCTDMIGDRTAERTNRIRHRKTIATKLKRGILKPLEAAVDQVKLTIAELEAGWD